jgi:ribonuclease P protein component
MPLTFPQTHRMKTPAEFERCYARKRSASDGLLIVYACENGLPHPRLGCSVSRKVGNAVVRNRYKRLFREAFRLSQHDLPPGVDVILIPRPGPYPELGTLRDSLAKLAHQAARKLGDARRPTPPAPLPEGKRENGIGNLQTSSGAQDATRAVTPFPSGRGAGGVGPARPESGGAS